MFGIVISCYLLMGHLSGLTSFGMPYLLPASEKYALDRKRGGDGILRAPLREMRYRPVYARRSQRVRLRKKEADK